jgi:Pentapeptide repeats (8 copies)
MNRRLSFCCALMLLSTVSAASAYNPADLNTLISTKKCVGCDLSGADLSGKQLATADLQAANLIGANLTGTNLTGAKLGGANLTGANLTGTNLAGAMLQAASLVDINFIRTNLTKTDFTYANLVNTSFRRAILSQTDLRGSNLALADFTGANLRNLNLTDANLTGTKGLPPARVDPPAPKAPVPSNAPQSSPNEIRRRDRSIPEIEESSPAFRRLPVYRIPPGLGKPQRLVPGGTRVTPSRFGEE